MARLRIHIIGGPGSGKSFVAAELSRRLGLPAYDLDDLFWNRSRSIRGIRADAVERDRRLAAIVAQDGWIIEGVYYGWLAPSFDRADIIIELTPSLWLRHWRVIRRHLRRRVGRAGSTPESVGDLWRLLRWSHMYTGRQLAEARSCISARGRRTVACATVEEVLRAVSSAS
jgi:adenylate kinase family enzyme